MKTTHIALILLFAINFGVYSQTNNRIPIDPNVRYGKLKNGLTYYIRHNEKPKERADFYIAQNVGAILEEDAQNGLAHFLEHMCFNGTKNFPDKSLLNYFQQIGVKFGQNINAYTSVDETVYNLSDIPTKTREGIIDTALLVLHDWSCAVSLENEEIDKERGVIREEWRTGQTAERRVMQARNEVMMAGSKYAKRTVIGDTSVINNFKYSDLKAYYKKWYRPDLQAILVVGDVDVDQIEKKIIALFSDIPLSENRAERIWFEVPDNKKPIVGVFTDPEMPSYQMLAFWKRSVIPDSIKLSTKGYILSLINRLITNMSMERFSDITQETNTPFISAASAVTGLARTADAYMFQCAPVQGKEDEARIRMLKEIETIRRYGFTESELQRAKTNFLSQMDKTFKEKNQQQNSSLINEYIRHFTEAEPIPGIAWEYDLTRAILPTIQLSSVNSLVSTYLPDENMVFTIAGPRAHSLTYPSNEDLLKEIEAIKTAEIKPYKDSEQNKPLIDSLPQSGQIKKKKFNKTFGTQEWMLSNGIKIVIKPTKFKDDEIRMAAWSEGGTSLYPTNEQMSASIATDLISYSGLGAFKATELQKLLTGKLVSVSLGIGTYDEKINGTSAVKDIETMLQLTHLYFTNIRKDENAYQLMMDQIWTYLVNTDNNPQKAYSDSVSLITYGYHPNVLVLNKESIRKIDMEMAYRIYKERFQNPADFTFVFVGNMDVNTFAPLIEKYLGSLKTNKTKEKWMDQDIRIQPGFIKKDIVKELQVKKTTNNIRYSMILPYNMKSIVQLNTLSEILKLRYTETLREKEGATYGVSVSASLTKRPIEQGSISIRFDTDPELSAKTLKMIGDEIDSIAKSGPTLTDLSKVKLNTIKQLKENEAENGWWLSIITHFQRDQINYLKDYQKEVEQLDVQSIQNLAKELIKQGNCIQILLQPGEKNN
jgi:zinc protease